MAIKFCQIVDSRLDKGSSDELHKLLVDRLKAIAAALKKLCDGDIQFANEMPRLMNWQDGTIQWRADCFLIKPRGLAWDQVYEAINRIHACPYDKMPNKEAEELIDVYARESAHNELTEPKTYEEWVALPPECLVYWPEHSDSPYSKADFIRLCNGEVHRAYSLYELCDWQCPETIIDESGGLENLYAEFFD